MENKMVDVSYRGLEGIEVLVSSGFGAGWSTWNATERAYDKRVVDLFKKYGPNITAEQEKTIAKTIGAMGYDTPYMGGWKNIHIEVVPRGALYWRINEYDGAESLEIFDSHDWTMFA